MGTPKTKILPNKFIVIVPYYKPESIGALTNQNIVMLGKSLHQMTGLITKISYKDNDPFIEDFFINIHVRTKNLDKAANGMRKGFIGHKKIEVRLVRLRYPYLDSLILAQYLAFNANKYNFTRVQETLFNRVSMVQSGFSLNDLPESSLVVDVSDRNQKGTFGPDLDKNPALPGNNGQESDNKLPVKLLPSLLTGVRLELAGRLATERSVPRKTVKNSYTGSLTVSNTLNS